MLGGKGFESYGVGAGEIQDSQEYYRPIPAALDLAKDEVLPPRPKPRDATQSAHVIAAEAGRHIMPLIKEAARATLAGIRLLDYQGVVVAASREELGMSYADLPETILALKGKHSSRLRKRISDLDPPFASISRRTQVRVSVTLPAVADGKVIGVILLSRSPRNMLKALYGKRYVVGAALVLLLLTALALALIISFTVTRPIGALARQAREIAQGARTRFAPIEHPVTEEVASLADSFAHMAETIELLQEHIGDMPADQPSAWRGAS